MTRPRFPKLLLMCTALIFSCAALAQDSQTLTPETPAPTAENGLRTDETSNIWFVELQSAPTADGTSLTTVRNEKAAFRQAAKAAGLKYTERYAYDQLFNGFSISIDKSQISTLSKISGVKNIYPVRVEKLPPTENLSKPDFDTALSMTGADIAQSQLGFTGRGVRVAVMDTGIDYRHPDLGGGTTFPTSRVVTGYDFVGDSYNADSSSASYQPVPHPDTDPMDCAGHGTHVSGIIGANGVVTGVAPNVTFGAYRVFGCSGSTTDDVMLAAMERILNDHMQILNMSIGSAYQWPEYPTAKASSRLVDKGMVVVAAIGNDGATGLYSASAPGVGEKVIGVASYDSTTAVLPYFTISPDATQVGYFSATGAPAAPTSGTADMVATSSTRISNDACSPLPAASLAGKVALIRRGTCSFYIKSQNAMAAGAIGVVLYNNVAGYINPTVAGSPAVTIPVVSVSDVQGAQILTRINAGPVQMTWTNQLGTFTNPTGGTISSFSSYGLSPDLTLKPDLGAPGGSIYSTFPLALGGYATLSGTSMATPHVSGAAALLLEAHPKTNSHDVRTLLQNSATPKHWWGAPSAPFLDNVHRQGAGIIQIDKTILAHSVVSPGKLSLGESQAGPSTQTITIQNNSAQAVTYNLSHAPALSTWPGTFSPSFDTGYAGVVFSTSSVTVPAHGSAQVQVTITANAGLPDQSMYGGYLVVAGGGETFHVPYAGFKGDYQSIQAMVGGSNPNPYLASFNGTGFVPQTSGASYTMQGNDFPFFFFHLSHEVRRFRMNVYSSSGKSFQLGMTDQQYMGRNSTSTGIFGFGYDGTTVNSVGKFMGALPNGEYYVVLSVEKALGTDSDPASWETWTSPVFRIARP